MSTSPAIPGATPHRRPARVFLLSFAVLLVAMTLWNLASPIASAPDEPSHFIRAAAVVRGQISTGPWAENPSMTSADVPAYVEHTHEMTCYAFRPEISAACVAPVDDDPNRTVTTGTTAGVNNPIYYAIVGLPSLFFDGLPALYAMRILSSILCAAALALMFSQLSRLTASRWSIAAGYVAVTPMVLYLSGSLNPNGLEVAAAGALFASLVATFRVPSGKWALRGQGLAIVVSTALLLSTRSVAFLWVLIIVGAAFALADWSIVRGLLRRPTIWVAVAATALVAVATAAWYALPVAGGGQTFAGAGTNPILAFATMLLKTFDFADGYVGWFGWVDTPSPSYSLIVWLAAIVSVIVFALAHANRHGRMVVVSLLVVFALAPASIQAALVATSGYIWQGRYMLAILLVLLVACGIVIDTTDGASQMAPALRRATLIAIVLLSIGQIVSFVWVLRRYVVSMSRSPRDMLLAPEWQPPLGWIGLTGCLAATVTIAGWAVYRWVVTERVVELHLSPETVVRTSAQRLA